MGEDSARASFAPANRAVRGRRTAQTRLPRQITKMNRSRSSDSKLSLDLDFNKHDHAGMITQPYHLYFERTDATKNMARFYAISIEPNLFGEACLTRRWGRIGTNGKVKNHQFEKEQDAVDLFLDLLRQKRRRGYRAIGSIASQ